MANTRPRLVKLLSNAEQMLQEAEALAVALPAGSDDERKALALLPELRESVRRVTKLLNEPSKAK